jgi:hypothetical protein
MTSRNRFSRMQSVSRGHPLGPVRVNQLQESVRAMDDLQRVEHFADGQHNALEVPWVLGHVDGTTGYLLDTTYGGGTITNPGTGAYTVSVAGGVLPTRWDAAVLLNVSDIAIEAKPHLICWEDDVSNVAIPLRIKELSSALGAGNTWADVNRDFDIAIHGPPQAVDTSAMLASTAKFKRSFLTDAATDWNALVENQAVSRAASLLEHDTDGLHVVNRIAKAVWWGKPTTGPSMVTVASEGIDSITYGGAGVVTLTLSRTMASVNQIAVFPEVQPASGDDLVIVNARALSSSTVRLYTYAFDGTNWGRDNRSLFCAVFGEE